MKRPGDRITRYAWTFLFALGAGFLALVVGSMITASLRVSLQQSFMRPGTALVLLDAALSSLWVLCVLPVFVFGLTRAFDIHPWACALGSAATGAAFTAALQLTIEGSEAFTRVPTLTVARAVFWAAGVWLATVAARRGRASAARSAERARASATVSQEQYDAFAAESQRIADKEHSRSE